MPRAFIVVGLGYGDEGKGSLVDALARDYSLPQVIRFNGGSQALHHVVEGDRFHGFSQFGAGTFAGARTLLSRFMLLEPLAFCREAQLLARAGIPDPYALVAISEKAPIITPANILANRIQELHRHEGRHGSCGQGIGLTQGDVETLGEHAIYARDLRHPGTLRDKLQDVWQRRLEMVGGLVNDTTLPLIHQLTHLDTEDLVAFYGEFAGAVTIVSDEAILEAVATRGTIFEGAQGVLLDQRFGFFPHVTRSNTTFANAETLLAEAGYAGTVTRIGLLRGYATRHGAGPFPTETDVLSVIPCHNATNPWQGAFRVGWFDAVTARYALRIVGGVDCLGLTNLDRLVGKGTLQAATSYRPKELFPDGEIPSVNAERVALNSRTQLLMQVQAEYTDLPSLPDDTEDSCSRFADAVSSLIQHPVSLLSNRPDSRKIYRAPL